MAELSFQPNAWNTAAIAPFPTATPRLDDTKNAPVEKPGEESLTDAEAADQLLESFGYTSQLSRNRSTAQVAFMSFVLSSIPYGMATTIYYPLIGGGPVNIIWGWVGVCCIVGCVALSLGEITSVYPTAGGMSIILPALAGFICFPNLLPKISP